MNTVHSHRLKQVPPHLLQVHAGLAPDLALANQDLWAMYKMRNLAPASDAVAAAAAPEGKTRAVSRQWFAVEKDKYGGKAWGQVWGGPSHVFFGHDAKRRLQLCPAATGLDTSCVYGCQLTCAVIPPLAELLGTRNSAADAAGATVSSGPRGGVGSGLLAAKLASRQTVTREDLGVEIVSVQAARAYLEPSAAAAAGPNAPEAVVAGGLNVASAKSSAPTAATADSVCPPSITL